MSKLHPLTGEPADVAPEFRPKKRDDGPSAAQAALLDRWPRRNRLKSGCETPSGAQAARAKGRSTGDPIFDEVWDALDGCDDLAAFRRAYRPFETLLRDARDGVTETLSRNDDER